MPANLLFSMGEHFSLKHIPFIGCSRIPFGHEEFFRNSSLLSSSFYSRQPAVVYGGSGSGKTSLISYTTNTLDPSAFRICRIELCEPQKRSVYMTIATKIGLRPAFYADDTKEQIIRFFRSENELGYYVYQSYRQKKMLFDPAVVRRISNEIIRMHMLPLILLILH